MRRLPFIPLLVALAIPAAFAGAQDAATIVRRADDVRAPGGSYVWDVTITTYDGSNAPSASGFEVFVRGTDKSYVRFTAPANRLGRSLLFLDRDLWIYLPDAGKPVRIPLAQRLVGQVASGDVARTNYSGDYTPTLVGSETVDGTPCWVLSLAATSRSVTYASIRYWVAKESYHPVKAEFYAGTGTLLKTGTFEHYREMGGVARPTLITLTDAIRKNLRSTIEFSNLRVRDLPEKMFNKGAMAEGG